VPELLTANEGWLVPAGDAAGFAKAIEALSETSNATLARMGTDARARAFARHDCDSEAATLSALFSEVTGP
jgi:colanic acid/amylovoran biosynthesis glycosyltransferase